jgi:hypothetical protein
MKTKNTWEYLDFVPKGHLTIAQRFIAGFRERDAARQVP